MIYVEAPNTCESNLAKLFLAGGISGCVDWQKDFIMMIDFLMNQAKKEFILFNPRRKEFNVKNKKETDIQIKWEFDRLRDADVIAFWFPEETVCPITLFELGAWSMTDKPVFVGVHPNYEREQDVYKQMKLVRPEMEVECSLGGLSVQVKDFLLKLISVKELG